MIRNCVLYKVRSEEPVEKIDSKAIQTVSLRECLKDVEGQAKKRIESLSKITRKEKLGLDEETSSHFKFSLSCEIRARRMVAAGDGLSPFVPVRVEAWLSKKQPYAVTFDAGRQLSSVAVSLMSKSVFGNLSAIENLKLANEAFFSLKDWLVKSDSKKRGEITRVTLQRVQADTAVFKQIVLSAPNLESIRLFKDLFPSAAAVSNMTFATPALRASNRPLLCKLTSWGGITVYTPTPLPSEFAELVATIRGFGQDRT
jgi:hypothetical protein